MNVALLPFFSQRNKATGKVQLDTCGSTKQVIFVAEQLTERGHQVCIARPYRELWPHSSFPSTPITWYNDNALNRIQWDLSELRQVAASCHVLIAWHEYAAIPFRALFPKLRIVQLCAVKPEPLDMFRAAWSRADVVAVQTRTMASFLQQNGVASPVVWPMCWDERTVTPLGGTYERDVDVLFVQRCSSTNYTHHEEVLAVLPRLAGLRVVFVDVTKYLRVQRPDLEYVEPADYVATMQRSKVAIALNDDMFGGQAIREAIVCGCLPLVRDAACYRELCGARWPHLVARNFGNLEEAVCRAVAEAPECDKTVPFNSAVQQSYQRTWPLIEETLK